MSTAAKVALYVPTAILAAVGLLYLWAWARFLYACGDDHAEHSDRDAGIFDTGKP